MNFYALLTNVSQVLSNLGTFILGVIATFTFCWGKSEFEKYKAQKKSEAAANILAEFHECIDSLIEITDERHFYQYLSYGREVAPATGDNEVHVERPSRLIYKSVNTLRKKTYLSISQIERTSAIHELLNKLKKYSKDLSSAIYTDLGNNDDLKKTENVQKELHNYRNTLDQMKDEATKILTPIIEGNKFCR